MTLRAEVIKKYNDGFVQVEIGAPNREPKYYKLPETKADAFQSEYMKNSRKMRWTTTGLMLAGIAAAITPVALLSKKIQNKTLRSAFGIVSGITGGVGAMFLSNKVEIKNHTKLLQKYEAMEVK